MQRSGFLATGWLVVASWFLAASAAAQVNLFDPPDVANLGGGADAAVVAAGGVLVAPRDGQPAMLYVTADIAPGWHIYSLDQAAPFKATKIKLASNDELTLLGPFAALTPPHRRTDDAVFKDVAFEEHSGTAIWRAPVQLAPGVDPDSVLIHGALNAQACAAQCLAPKDYAFSARLGEAPTIPRENDGSLAVKTAPSAAPAAATAFRQTGRHTALSGNVSPRVAAAGGKVKLVLEAAPDAGYHTYAHAPRPQTSVGSKPTLIVLDDVAGLRVSPPTPDSPPIEKPGPTGAIEPYHDRPVRWTIEIDVPKDASPGRYPITGLIGYQSCSEANCDLPSAARFQAALEIGNDAVAGPLPLAFQEAKYSEAAKAASGQRSAAAPAAGPAKVGGEAPSGSVWSYLGLAFLGGLILNVMPCVLPVIQLKILSFIEQGHQDRAKVLSLNLAYSAGMIAVFLTLATLPVIWHAFYGQNFTWGQQFTYDSFTITLACVVFALGLSMLGIWEIPIPGLFTSQRASTWAAQEGYAGAFAKGVITTVLATPCTAPFLGSALSWATVQPPYLVYTAFFTMGLGMASPYLLIGAFPRLLAFLPKPGMWMETFKQAMAFLLLGTVVYLLSLLESYHVVPTVTLLIGVWAACWWIGRTPWTVSRGKQLAAWAQGAVVAGIVGAFAFVYVDEWMEHRFQNRVSREIDRRLADTGTDLDRALINPNRAEHELPWRPFTRQRLASLLREGKTVLVDFTADWCPTCKALEKFVLNTREVNELVERNSVVPLVADYTHLDDEIAQMLAELKSNGVPVLAIYSAGQTKPSTVFNEGGYLQQDLLNALKQAGPSRDDKEQLSSASPGRRGS